MTPARGTVTGECPRCSVTTTHRLIGSDVCQCRCCGHIGPVSEIRIYEPPAETGARQRELFGGGGDRDAGQKEAEKEA